MFSVEGFPGGAARSGRHGVLVEGAWEEDSEARVSILIHRRGCTCSGVGGTEIQLLSPRPAPISAPSALSSLKTLIPGRAPVSYPVPGPEEVPGSE